ncbi:SDR family NAD(P)-dependent oxidoreductase [Nocardioides pantholopis]|uniref:SDR family NAD(P)-dependent oxidoreductase n=1 Tax=Nocardioides pantholopis TaxID=2483798 RepID=UPI000F08B909|nr:glucose 1-dehydrogenase [Nocardioides pantholopis]
MSAAGQAPAVRLDGKVVWVTGASRGLGRSVATGLVAAGAQVVLSARSAEDLDRLVAELPRDSCSPIALTVDDEPAVDAAVEQIVARHGRLDGLVNGAGISPTFTPAVDVAAADWRQVLGVNLTGTFLCARAAGRQMLAQGSGSVVNVTSVHARQGFERIAAYAASKGGVEALTRVLSLEWATAGVRVNNLAPGYYDTDLSHGLLESRWGDRIRSRTPMGRTGLPHELVGAAVFLLSDAASFVTGSTLTVDGGWSAW